MFKRDRYGDIDPEATLQAAAQNIQTIKDNFSMKKILSIVLVVVLSLVVVISAGSIVETVPTGHYQIKQAAVTGQLTAKMSPGLWFQNFGDIFTFPICCGKLEEPSSCSVIYTEDGGKTYTFHKFL